MQDLIIKRLFPEDAEHLSRLLTDDDSAYGRFFTPFASDAKSLSATLASVKQDRFWGLWFNETLAGFFMLRGFDEGYLRPSFGVYISPNFSRRGLSKLALEYSMSWCRLNGILKLMLKVHPDNTFAKKTYEQSGFRFLEVCPRTGHNIMEKTWDGGK